MTRTSRVHLAAFITVFALAACEVDEVPVEPQSTPPSTPTWTGVIPGAIANDNEPTLQGKADASATVHVYEAGCDGSLLGTTVADANGAFALRVKVADDSTSRFFAAASDARGTHSSCSEPLVYTEDSTPPAAPLWPAAALSPANENEPELEGTAEAGARVSLFLGDCSGTPVAEAVTGADGVFRAKAQVADDSQSEFRAIAIDAAGNISTCSAPRLYVEDSTPPVVPTWTRVLPAPIANENRPTVEGTSEPGSTLHVFGQADCAGAVVATVVADEAGHFSATVDVADDSVTDFTVRAVDAAGNASACSASLTYTELSRAPSAPVLSRVLPSSLANENEPTLEGQAVAGATVEIHHESGCAGDPIARVEVDENGAFSATVQVADDSVTHFSAIAIDVVGGRSSCSADLVYTEDSTPPAAPSLTGTTPASPSSSESPTLAGTAEPLAIVRIYAGSTCAGTPVEALADAAGAFQVTLTVAGDSQTSFVADAVDAAGNASGCSSPLVYVSDSTAPAAPVLTGFDPASPSNVSSPRLLGTAEALASLEIFVGAGCSGAAAATATAAADGAFDVEVSAASNSTSTFSARATDAAGNVSDCSNALAYEHDDIPPTAPVFSSVQPGSIANENSPTIHGAAEPGIRIELFLTACTGAAAASGSADGSGAFGISLDVHDDESHAIHARAVDAAGNGSDCAGPLEYIEDSTPPAISGAQVRDGQDVTDLEFQRDTTGLDASWAGFTDLNGVVSYERNVSRSAACAGEAGPTEEVGSVTSHRYVVALSEGRYFNCVRAIDAAGNRSAWVASNGITVDLTPPSLIASMPIDGATSVDLRTAVMLSFSETIANTSEASIEMLIGGTPVPVQQSWSVDDTVVTLRPSEPYPHLAQVEIVVRAGLSDRLGNVSTQEFVRRFTARDWQWELPTSIPSASGIGSHVDIATDDTGHVVALWAEPTGSGGGRVWTRTYAPGQGWNVPSLVSPLWNADTGAPSISLADGAGAAVWRQKEGLRYDVYARRWSAATGWEEPELIELHDGDASEPRVYASPDGSLFVAWAQYDGAGSHVWANHYTPGTGWGAATRIDSGTASTIRALAGSLGRAMVVWIKGSKVMVSRFASGSWTAPEEVNAGESATIANAWAAIAPDGSAVVVYDHESELANDLYARRYTPGVGWSGAQLMFTSPGHHADRASVGMDDSGNALVIWRQVNGGVHNLAWRRHDGAGWTSPDSLVDHHFSSALSVSRDGRAHVAYVHREPSGSRISAIRFDPASGWSSPQHLETTSYPSALGRLDSGIDGTAALIWLRPDQNFLQVHPAGSIFN